MVDSKKSKTRLIQFDIAHKFAASIMACMIFLSSVAGYIIYQQESSTLTILLDSSGKVVEDIFEDIKNKSSEDVSDKAQKMADFLAQISPDPIANIDLTLLQSYADTVIDDVDINYVIFFDEDGSKLIEAGEKNSIENDKLISVNISAEGIEVGVVNLGYTYDRLIKEEKNLHEAYLANVELLREAKDESLTEIIIGLSISMAILAILVSGLAYFLLKVIVISRLSKLESRFYDIAAGEGDLRQRIEINGNDAIDRLGNNFNIFVSKIHETIKEVTSFTGDIMAASEVLTAFSDESKKLTESQREDITLSVTAITEMTSTVAEIARNATVAAESAHNADTEAREGKQIVIEATKSIENLANSVASATSIINELEEESNHINVVIDVIKGIAEQTNLLALNAAIEAARAGEQGRGFAVVADEVRTLASRTQASTQEINDMIEGLQKRASAAAAAMSEGSAMAVESVERAEKAAESLSAITLAVATITDMNIQIASATEEQNAVSNEINNNIVAINASADKSFDVSQQTAQSSNDMTDLALRLTEIIGKFKV